MISTYEQLMIKLYGTNVYKDVNVNSYPIDVSGGNPANIFAETFDRIRPSAIIEVGAWKGKTTMHFAHMLRSSGVEDPVVIAVDTWLGSAEHHMQLRNDPTWGIAKYMEHGRSNLYEQFLVNVMCNGYSDIVVPIVNTSVVAFRILYQLKMLADFIYIDGDHGEDECYADMSLYWELLRSGGVMAGDDFSAGWHTVICAVSRFAKERGLTVRVVADKWMIIKP